MDISSVNNQATHAPVAGEASAPKPVPAEQRTLIQAVKAVNAADLFGQDNELTFVLDRNSRSAVARVVNKKTHQVVEQIPAEYVLRMAEELKRS